MIFFLFKKKEKDRNEVAPKRKKTFAKGIYLTIKGWKNGTNQNLNMIARWGYLDLFQLALLVNKNIKNVERQLPFLRKKGFILINQQTRKNIYSFSTLGSKCIGKESKKGHINLNQLIHQD